MLYSMYAPWMDVGSVKGIAQYYNQSKLFVDIDLTNPASFPLFFQFRIENYDIAGDLANPANANATKLCEVFSDPNKTEDYMQIYHSTDGGLDTTPSKNHTDHVENFDCLPDPDPKYNSRGYFIWRFNANESTAPESQTNYNIVSGNIYRVQLNLSEVYDMLAPKLVENGTQPTTQIRLYIYSSVQNRVRSYADVKNPNEFMSKVASLEFYL
jgi:hypothetical protein